MNYYTPTPPPPGSLFALPPHNGTPTSIAAAAAIVPLIGGDELRILKALASGGMTCDALEVALGLSHQTASARLRGLAKCGRVEDSGATRPTRTGRQAVVWIVDKGEKP